MTQAVLNGPVAMGPRSENLLRGAATLWFLVAAIGHWIFMAYLLAYYMPLLYQGGLPALGTTHLPEGYIPGDTVGNLAIAAHIVLAVIIVGGGPLQLIPQIRARAPVFHHWLGRSYITAAVVSSLAGIYMVWARGTVGDLLNDIAITLDGVLILAFAAIALRHAIARNIRQHRRWALRLFLVAGGVWFFRIGLMGWVFMTGGIGVDFATFSGPFITFWSFGQYLLPLAILQLYFYTQDHATAGGRIAMSTGLAALAVLTGIGIFAATVGMWLPRM